MYCSTCRDSIHIQDVDHNLDEIIRFTSGVAVYTYIVTKLGTNQYQRPV